MIDPDDLGRTTKIDLDDGSAATIAEAMARASARRLCISLGAGWSDSAGATAAALTAIRCGTRAFGGGVIVVSKDDPVVRLGWGRGMPLADILRGAGAHRMDRVPADTPLVVSIAGGVSGDGVRTLHATWEGWAGGVVGASDARLAEDDANRLAGVVAGAIAVSESFQAAKGNVVASRRDAGLSLWKPGVDWRDPDARGPSLAYLPTSLWLLGLGHLGQANAWALGWLPYPAESGALVGLVDADRVIPANIDTGLLLLPGDVRRPKARTVARELETLGLGTLVSERRFGPHFTPSAQEPSIALAGFDSPGPRRVLESVGFTHVVDAGLGSARQYLDIVVWTFPGSSRAADVFPDAPGSADFDPRTIPAYATAMAELEASGQSPEAAACGVSELAGRTAGAAFVGAIAGCLSVADILRDLHNGPRIEAISLSLSDPGFVRLADNPVAPPPNRGFVRVRG
ncbi:MAG: hypothetical protein U0838_02375 [Chloroflexota bacterium]